MDDTLKTFCSECKTHTGEEVEQEESLTYKGHTITFMAVFQRCKTCGETWELGYQLDENLRRIREHLNREGVEHGLAKKENDV